MVTGHTSTESQKDGRASSGAVFRSLRYRNYRLFFSGQSLSLIGTWIQSVATAWLVYRLTGSALLLGVFGFAGQIPNFLLAPFTGALTDRYNRPAILITTQSLAMLQALTLAFLYFAGTIQVWHLMVAGVFLGCVNAFDMPARQSFVVEMIERREDLGNAIALNSSMVNGARLVGPSIAGVLIAGAGEGVCFLLNGISYLFVIASLLMMRVERGKGGNRHADLLQEVKEGFAYTFGFAPIRSIILLLALVSLVGMPYTLLMPVFAKEILHGGSHTFGFLIGASGTGALVGAVYLASRRSVLGLGTIIAASAAFFGVGLILFSLSRIFLLSMTLMFLTGLGMMLQIASSNTILQTIVDDDKRGRVMSFYTMAFLGTAPFGSLLAGSLASTIGAPTTLLIAGVLCIAGGTFFAAVLPRLRTLVRPIYVRMGIMPDVASGVTAGSDMTTPPPET